MQPADKIPETMAAIGSGGGATSHITRWAEADPDGAAQAGAGAAIYVKEGSDISSPEDLAGRTLGVPSFGASTTMQTQMVLAEGYDLAFPLDFACAVRS